MKSADLVVNELYAVAHRSMLPDSRFPTGAQPHLVTRARVLSAPENGRVQVRALDPVVGRVYNGYPNAQWADGKKGHVWSTTTRRVLMPWAEFAAEAATAQQLNDRTRATAVELDETVRDRLTKNLLSASVFLQSNGTDHVGITQYTVTVVLNTQAARRLIGGAAGIELPEDAFTERVHMSATAVLALLDSYEQRVS